MPNSTSTSAAAGATSAPAAAAAPHADAHETLTHREIRLLRERLVEEAATAVGMIEQALEALWRLDADVATAVVSRDEAVNREEVAIEENALKIMALHQPMAKDFRELAFILKVNADIERVADHACSIAKVARKLRGSSPSWPTALVELGQRVPMACHSLLRALRNEDAAGAKAVIAGDKTIDNLHKQLFHETVALMQQQEGTAALGLLVYRLGRDLERIGDLMTNIGEDLVYLVTGEIVRHEKKRFRAENGVEP